MTHPESHGQSRSCATGITRIKYVNLVQCDSVARRTKDSLGGCASGLKGRIGVGACDCAFFVRKDYNVGWMRSLLPLVQTHGQHPIFWRGVPVCP